MKPEVKRRVLGKTGREEALSDRPLAREGEGYQLEFEKNGREGEENGAGNGGPIAGGKGISELACDGKVLGGRKDGRLSGERLSGGKEGIQPDFVGEIATAEKDGTLSNGALTEGKEGGLVEGKDKGGTGKVLEERIDGRSVEEVKGEVASGSGRVRRANFDDLDAIVDINDNIYDGLDYMQALFYVFMQSKQYVIYVYELDGKLMALRTFYFVPGTDDLVTIMSIRVRPSFQGHGFGRPDQNPIMDQFRKDYPQVTRYIIQTLFKPHVQAKIDRWKILYHWTELKYKLPHRQLLKRFATLGHHKTPDTRPTRVSYTKGCEWLKRSDQLLKFLARYADEYIVADANWTAVKLESDELRRMFTYSNVFVSFSGTTGESSDDTVVIIPEGSGEIISDEIAGFSTSSHFQCNHGVNFEIHFYGDSEADLLSHVYSHMIQYVSVTQDDVRIACSLHFPLSIDARSVRQRLKNELGDIVQTDYFSETEAVQYMAPLVPSVSNTFSN